MNKIRRYILASLAATASLFSFGEPIKTDSVTECVRPVTALFHFDAGTAHLADTYLSPIKYSGWNVGFGYDRWQAMKGSPEKWVINLRTDIRADHTTNIVGNATMWNLEIAGSWSAMRKWHLPYFGGIVTGIGPGVRLDLGCFYTARNGNNPASAKGSVTIGATGFLGKRFCLKGKVLDLRWTSDIALAGVFFSPDYGELYYEIWLGNHAGLTHFAWPGNFFRWNNSVSADIHLGNTILSIGYRGKVFSSKVNHLTTRAFTHAFSFGIGGEWISVSPYRGISRATRMISAIY